MVKLHCCSRVNKNQVHQISDSAISGHQLESLHWANCCLEKTAHSLNWRSSYLLEMGRFTQPTCWSICQCRSHQCPTGVNPILRRCTHKHKIFFKTFHFLGQ